MTKLHNQMTIRVATALLPYCYESHTYCAKLLVARTTRKSTEGYWSNNMPICTNPKCGQITKIMSLYCPSCGQQTLSKLDRGQVEGPHSAEISMENFDRITRDVPAKSEKPYSRSKSKRHSRNCTKKHKIGTATSIRQQKHFSAAFSLVSLILGVIAITIGLADLAAIDQGKFLYLQDSEIILLLVLNLGSTGMAVAAYIRRHPYWRGAFSIAFISILVFIACLQYDLDSVFGF